MQHPTLKYGETRLGQKERKSQSVLSFFLFSLFSLCWVNFSVKNRKLVSCNRFTRVSILLIRKFLQIKPTQHSTLKFGEPRLGQKERKSQRVLSFALFSLFSLFSLCCVNFSMKNRKLVSCNRKLGSVLFWYFVGWPKQPVADTQILCLGFT